MILACPHCGAHNRQLGRRPEIVPKSGDVSLCFHCRRSAVFYNGPLGLGLRAIGVDPDPATDMAVRAVRSAVTESDGTVDDTIRVFRERYGEEWPA